MAVDVPLAHLDRLFDYAIPEDLDAEAQIGVRVRVRFSGRLVDGFVVERAEESEHPRLAPLQRVVSPVPVLTPEVLDLARAVADRYAGTLPDVLRAAIPPRHARAEAQVLAKDAEPCELPEVDLPTWGDYTGGQAFAERVLAGERGLRGVWTSAPGAGASEASDWPRLLARTALAAAQHGGVGLVVPDARDLARVASALDQAGAAKAYATLSADAGPQRRYAAYMRVLTGRVPIAIGTRAAAFAPVELPALFILWDDGDESLAEPHAPGWHAREVLALRAHLTGASLLVGGFTRTVETQQWIATSWAAPLAPRKPVLRALAPRVIADDDGARIPRRAYEAARTALESGPVLVQVGRRGYVPTLACQRCRERAACPACGGPLALGARGGAPVCRWCGTRVAPWHCRACGGDRLRAVSVGSSRTAEELGRAFPGIPVLTSTGERSVDQVGSEPALVIATTGTEPWAAGGYTAVLLLDAAAQAARVALRAGEETARRWFAAAALARPGSPVVVTADAGLPVMQALIRWDPGWLAERELQERRDLGLPPTVRAATLTGDPAAVVDARHALPASARVLGPLPAGDEARILVTVDRRHGPDLTRSLSALAATRAARKDTARLHIAVDPPDWGGD